MELTRRLMAMSKTAGATNGKVSGAVEAIMRGDKEEAAEKIACLSPNEISDLREALNKHAETNSTADMGGHTRESNEKAKERIERDENKPSTQGGAQPTETEVKVNKGSDGGTNPPINTPTISTLLSQPIDETIRTPEGAGDTDSDLKKKAEFEAGFVAGIKRGVEEITGLVQKHGSYDIRKRFGDVFDKMASVIGEEAATDALLEGFAEGQKHAQLELERNEEVKMGSLTKIVEDQQKIASAEDLRNYGFRLGREALLTKVAEDQRKHAEEITPEGGEMDPEVAEAAETAAIVNAIADKVMTDPESVTPEEAEVLLTVGDAIEDAEGEAIGDEEKVTTIVDIAAYLRKYGYAQ